MELMLKQVEQEATFIPEGENIRAVNSCFIEANTQNVSIKHLKNDCTIPVFSKDNERTLAHHEFIRTTYDCAATKYGSQHLTFPEIRVSHVVKGRIPTAINKPVKELLEHEKTIYYERMMFAFEITNISQMINGNQLSLVVGGVRAYNQENLYSKKSLEKFKVFIGFKNRVCTNLCVSSDGYAGDIRVGSLTDLKHQIFELIENYQVQHQIEMMQNLSAMKLTEKQFAQLIGRCRLYNYLPKDEKDGITPILLNDGQLNAVARDYYQDEHFRRDANGDINLWNLYNLFTGSNKSSYIDTYLDRSVSVSETIQELAFSLQNSSSFWYLY